MKILFDLWKLENDANQNGGNLRIHPLGSSHFLSYHGLSELNI